VQMLFDKIKADPFKGKGSMHHQWNMEDGSVVHAYVNTLGAWPIVRTWIESPVGTTSGFDSPIEGFKWESGYLSWQHPIPAEGTYPLIVLARGQLASYLKRGDYASKVYTTREVHDHILGADVWGDPADQLDTRLVASQYSGWMRLLIQAFASTGRRLDDVFRFPGGRNLTREYGLLLSPANEFWFVRIGSDNGVTFTKATMATSPVRALQSGTNWAVDTERRMLWCEVMAGFGVDPSATQVVQPDAAAEVFSAGRQFVSSVHQWQWSRQKNQGAALVYALEDSELGQCWDFSVFTADITWSESEDDGLIPNAAIARTRSGMTYLHHGVFLWTATTVYGQLMLNLITSAEELYAGIESDLTDPVPAHLFYDLPSDELQILEMFPPNTRRTETTPVVAGTPEYFYRGASYSVQSETRLDERKGSFLRDRPFYVAVDWPQEFIAQQASGGGGTTLDYNYNWSHTSTQVLPYGFSWPTPYAGSPVEATFYANLEGLSAASEGTTKAQWLKVWRTSYSVNGQRATTGLRAGDHREALIISALDPTVYLHLVTHKETVYPSYTFTDNGTAGGAACRAELWEMDENANFLGTIYNINGHESTYPWPTNVTGNPVTTREFSETVTVSADIYSGTRLVASIPPDSPTMTYLEVFLTYNTQDPDSFYAPAGTWYGFASAGGVLTYNHAHGQGRTNTQGYPNDVLHERYSVYGLWIGGA